MLYKIILEPKNIVIHSGNFGGICDNDLRPNWETLGERI